MDTVSIGEVRLENLVTSLSDRPEFLVFLDNEVEQLVIMDDLDVTLSIRSGACSYEMLKILQENILNYLDEFLANQYRTVLMEEKVRFRKDNENPFVQLNIAIRTKNLEYEMDES